MPEYVIIGLLIFIMIAQNVFWMRVNLQLIDRLMSRNYFEFTQGKKNEKPIPPQMLQLPQDDAVDPESERQAQELNSLFNMM